MFNVQDLNPDVYFQGDLDSDPNQYEMDPENQWALPNTYLKALFRFS